MGSGLLKIGGSSKNNGKEHGNYYLAFRAVGRGFRDEESIRV